MQIYIVLVLTFACFLSGSVMYSYLIPRYIKNIDPREGSYDKNPGGSNAIRICGQFIGLICIILDILKAFIPVYISINYFKISNLYIVPIAIAPVLGHAFSPFLNFNGGKAVSSTFGLFLALYPQSYIVIIFALIILFFKLIITITPNSSLMIVSILTLVIFMFLFTSKLNIKLIALIISLIVCYKQKLNPDEGENKISLFNHYFKKTIHSNIAN